jgi:hypothetical protein
VSQILPFSFILLLPPDPPALAEELDGGASGIFRINSTPDSMAVMICSCGKGTRDWSGLSIAQFNAIVDWFG